MNSSKHLVTDINQYLSLNLKQSRQANLSSYKAKLVLRSQRKAFQKKLFGEHYNYSRVGLNKEKKYLLEEQKNTEIQRANRILLEKLQKIARGTVPNNERKRTITEHSETSPINDQIASLKSRNFSTVNKSIHNPLIQQITLKTPSQKPAKILFQGHLSSIDKTIHIKTFIQNSFLIISSSFDKTKQKLFLDLDTYRKFYRQTLQTNHNNIIHHITFNGKYINIMGIKPLKRIVEEKGTQLPPLYFKSQAKGIKIQKNGEKIDFGYKYQLKE